MGNQPLDDQTGGVSVRTALASDLDLLASLGEKVQSLHHEHRPDLFAPPSIEPHLEFLASILEDPEWLCLVAVEGDQPRGFAVVEFQRPRIGRFRVSGPVAYLHQLGVGPESRRQGIGRQLLNAVFDEAGRRGSVSVQLDSWAFNAAGNDFFRSSGFSVLNQVYERVLNA